MENHMRPVFTITRTFVLIAVVALAVPALAGCNTVHGAGEDVESVGHAVQHGARSVQHHMDD
jgi:predicted small secreted protein